MKRVSKSQAEKNRAIAEIKRNLPKVCFICGQPCTGDAAHLLPKSIFPQYYTVKLIKDAGGNAALKSISIKHKGSKMEN